MSGNRIFVWDLHNTLVFGAETADAEAFNYVIKGRGVRRRYTHEQLRTAGPTWRYKLTALVPELEVTDETIEELRRKQIEMAPDYISAASGAGATLNRVKEKGDSNIVISWAMTNTIDAYLNHLRLKDFVDERYSVFETIRQSDLKGEDVGRLVPKYKAQIMRRFVDRRETFVVGDMEGDIEAGLEVGATTFLFSEKQIATRAHHVIKMLPEVVTIVYGETVS